MTSGAAAPTLSTWRATSLAEVGSYLNGFAFNDEHWSTEGLPIVRIAQITGSQAVVDRFGGTLPHNYLDDGDLIFSWSGTLRVAQWFSGPAWLNQHLFKVVPDDAVDRGFLYHLLSSCVAEMEKRTHGSTMKHIKRGELREFAVLVPRDKREQSQIASVLDTLDSAIRKTEAIIEKLKQVRQGLLHDLLTRGVDENGELSAAERSAASLQAIIAGMDSEGVVHAEVGIMRRSGRRRDAWQERGRRNCYRVAISPRRQRTRWLS